MAAVQVVIGVRDGELLAYGLEVGSAKPTRVAFKYLAMTKDREGEYVCCPRPLLVAKGGVAEVWVPPEEPGAAAATLEGAWNLIAPYRRGLALVRSDAGVCVRDEATRRIDKVRVAVFWLELARTWLRASGSQAAPHVATRDQAPQPA
jgi:hypothetical protein